MQSVYRWEKTTDYPAISRILAALPRILERILPACVGDIPPKPGAFSGRDVIETRGVKPGRS
jgi:hypothetical protein